MDVSKEFIFDAAHRITSHPGKCSSCHGHTWRVRVTVRGQVNATTGMVVDFYVLRNIGDALLEQWDHAALLAEWDPLVLACREVKSRLVVFPFEPTSENLVNEVAGHFRARLPSGVELVRAEIWETPSCSAATET